MSQRRGLCLARVVVSMAMGKKGRGGREEEGKGRRELASAVGPRPLLHSQSFCHDCMILVNNRPLVLEGRKRNQGGSDRAGRRASLGSAPCRVFLFGMAGPSEADLARVDVLRKRMSVACDERERETLLRETAALLGHRGVEGALLVWQGGDRERGIRILEKESSGECAWGMSTFGSCCSAGDGVEKDLGRLSGGGQGRRLGCLARAGR